MNEDTNFAGAYTCVFWSLKDCPIPSGLHLVSVEAHIIESLEVLGYYGGVEIRRHGEDGQDVDVNKLIFDIINFAPSFCPEPINLVVISKQISEASELFRVLCALRLRDCNVLLVEPPDSAPELMFETAETIINCTKTLDGGDPKMSSSDDSSSDDSSSDSDYE